MRRATPPCSNWTKKGRCKYGDECRYSHAGPQGLTPQTTQICPRWEKKGACKFGHNCTLSHAQQQLLRGYVHQSDQLPQHSCPRWKKKGACKFGANCTLSHDQSMIDLRAQRQAAYAQQQQQQAAYEAEQQRQQDREVARKRAEEKAKKKTEEKARKKAEEKARKKAEEKARKKAEEKARKKAEEKARKKAEEKATSRKKAEEKARKKAEEKARKKAEEEEASKKVDDDDDYENLCQVCMDHPVYDSSGCSFMVAPCGHVFACEGCLNNLRDHGHGCAMCRGRIETVQKIYPTVKPPPPSSSGSGGGGGGSFKTASVQLVEASSTMGLTVTRQVRRLDFCLLYYIPCPILFMSFGTHLFSIIPLHVPCNIPLTHYISCFFNIVDF